MIRPARLEELPLIVAMGLSMITESPRWRALPRDAARVAAVVAETFADGGALVLTHNDVPVGFCLCGLATHPFGPALYCAPIALWVEPESRGRHGGVRLLKALARWGRERGAVECLVGSHAGIEDDVFRGLVQRLGFEHAGTNFRLDL